MERSEPPALTEAQKRYLRGRGHALKPVVMVGQAGVSDAVVREVDEALAAHELVKVKLRVGDRATRDAAIERLAAATGAALVHRIGHVALIYRPRPRDRRIILPRTAG